MSDQSIRPLHIPHSIKLIYIIAASDAHCQSDASVDASYLTKFHLRMLQSGYTTVPAALREAHMRQNVSMWEGRGQSQYLNTHTQTHTHTHTHTHTLLSAQQPKRTPLLPYLKRCQGLVPCQRQAHFHRQNQEALWHGAAPLLFLNRAFSAQTFCV